MRLVFQLLSDLGVDNIVRKIIIMKRYTEMEW